MNKVFIVVMAMVVLPFSIRSQELGKEESKGNAIIQVFANAHTGFGTNNDDRGFELDRSYVGYQYSLGKGLSVKAVLDVGQSSDVDDYHHLVYVKHAQATWKTGNLTLDGGLISTTQFKVQST